MPNAIQLASSCEAVISDIYKAEAKTNDLTGTTQVSSFLGKNEIKVLEVNTDGLGNYSRNTGYQKGSVTANWVTKQLTVDRGVEFQIDDMDNEETLNLTVGQVVGKFARKNVLPEVDAYRFATISSWAGVDALTPAAITASQDLIDAIRGALANRGDNEVTETGNRLYLSSKMFELLKGVYNTIIVDGTGRLNTGIKEIDDLTVIKVPQKRFYTGITLNPGTSAWGFANAGQKINFMIVDPEAVKCPVKLNRVKAFDPQTYQGGDFWDLQFRLYHDVFVDENMLAGITVSTEATA